MAGRRLDCRLLFESCTSVALQESRGQLASRFSRLGATVPKVVAHNAQDCPWDRVGENTNQFILGMQNYAGWPLRNLHSSVARVPRTSANTMSNATDHTVTTDSAHRHFEFEPCTDVSLCPYVRVLFCHVRLHQQPDYPHNYSGNDSGQN